MADNNELLHVGKLSEEAKTTLTEAMHERLAVLAREARCNPSDLLRDAVYLVFSGVTYSDHVANDRRGVMKLEGRQLSDRRATE